MSSCFYFVRYWAMCVLQLFVNQVVTLWILKLTLSFKSSLFPTWPKIHEKNLNKRNELLRWNKNHFLSFLKGFQWSKFFWKVRARLRTLDMAPASSNEFLDIQANYSGFTLKLVRDMITTYRHFFICFYICLLVFFTLSTVLTS